MKQISFLIALVVTPVVILWASDSDWTDNSWGEEEFSKIENSAFEKSKIKNRSKKEYDDKVYKYITGDYKVENNNIELANIYLDDSPKNEDIKINVMTENLKVQGDSYKDSIEIKRNKYKNFVQNDERGVTFFEEEDTNQELANGVQLADSRYNKVPNEDISELGTVNLQGKEKIKEVNVFVEDVTILVD